ncbi:MAG: MFS transporter, partial [Hyphomonadaceae bacterium]
MAETNAAATPAPPLSTQKRLQAILGGSAGNLVEWYDWFAYSSFALYFAKVFFPKGDQTAQLLQAAAVFAIGFLARPIGAWLMGLYADRAGRRAALTLSVAMMCAGSFVIAITPGHAQIGTAAPAILLAARVLQGLSVGGEYGASATYMSEMAGRARRGFWSSFQYVTLIAGQLIALGVLILLQNALPVAALESWGWRIPFVIGGVLAIVVFWIRRGIAESASFENRGGERARTMLLFLHHPRETLMVAGLTAGGSLAFYAYTTYMQKFLTNTAGFTKNAATEISAAALFCFMLAQPLAG